MTEERCWRIERSKYETEADLQGACNEWLDTLHAQGKLYYFHAGNYADKVKDKGSVPDLLIHPVGFYDVSPFTIELKRPDGKGTFTDRQKVFNHMIHGKRIAHYVVNCMEHAKYIIDNMLAGDPMAYIRYYTGCRLNFRKTDMMSPDQYAIKLASKRGKK